MGIVGFALLPQGLVGREKKGLELTVGLSPPYMLEEGPCVRSTRMVGARHRSVFNEARGSVDAWPLSKDDTLLFELLRMPQPFSMRFQDLTKTFSGPETTRGHDGKELCLSSEVFFGCSLLHLREHDHVPTPTHTNTTIPMYGVFWVKGIGARIYVEIL